MALKEGKRVMFLQPWRTALAARLEYAPLLQTWQWAAPTTLYLRRVRGTASEVPAFRCGERCPKPRTDCPCSDGTGLVVLA